MKNKEMYTKFLIKLILSNQIKNITIFGSSMLPTLPHGTKVPIETSFKLKQGDIVVAYSKKENVLVAHRVVFVDYTKKRALLLGDNQKPSAKKWYRFKEIIARVNPKRKNCKSQLRYKQTSINLVLDLPYGSPKYFDEKSLQIYQALKANKYNCFYHDLNIDFQKKIYGEKLIKQFKEFDWENKDKFLTIQHLISIKRQNFKLKYGLNKLTYKQLCLCDSSSDREIESTIKDYRKSVYYKYYLDIITEILKKHNINSKDYQKLNIFVSVNNFDKLISAIIFSQTIFEKIKIKPILVDNSTLFNGNYNTGFISIFFRELVSGYEFCKFVSSNKNDFSIINFDTYLSKYKIAPLNIRRECYFKGCKFCDRHNKDNFCFSLEDMHDKIFNLYKLGVSKFVFQDDCLVPSYIKELLTILKKDKISIQWQGNFRFEKSLNTRYIKFLSKNGCVFLFFGLETFSQNLLDKMNKQIKIKNVIKTLKACKKYQIPIKVSLMFNYVNETTKDLKQTYNLINKYHNLIDFFEINFFVNTKNSKLQQNACHTLSYFDKVHTPTKENLFWINKILDFLTRKKKLDSFYCKNYTSWQK